MKTPVRAPEIGAWASTTRLFSEEAVHRFAIVSGDMNPLHLDPEYAKGTQFGQRIVHGALVASLFSALLGTQVPGEGCVYLGQTLEFRAPVYLNEEVTATVQVTCLETKKSGRLVTLRCLAVAHRSTGVDDVVLTGEAKVLVPWAYEMPCKKAA